MNSEEENKRLRRHEISDNYKEQHLPPFTISLNPPLIRGQIFDDDLTVYSSLGYIPLYGDGNG